MSKSLFLPSALVVLLSQASALEVSGLACKAVPGNAGVYISNNILQCETVDSTAQQAKQIVHAVGHKFVKVTLNGELLERDAGTLAQSVSATDEIEVIAAIAGG